MLDAATREITSSKILRDLQGECILCYFDIGVMTEWKHTPWDDDYGPFLLLQDIGGTVLT